MTIHHNALRYDLVQSKPSQWLGIDDLSLEMADMGGQPINIGSLNSSLRDARMMLGQQLAPRADSRFGWESDGDGGLLRDGRIDAYQRRQDARDIDRLRRDYGRDIGSNAKRLFAEWRDQQIERIAEERGIRRDAASGFVPGGVGGFPRDFEFIRSKIWEEERQPLTALELFPQDTSVPLGARKHTARRRLGRGIARIMRGDSFVPRANVGFVEEQFGVIYIVCGVGQNFFEQLTMDFANLDAYGEGLRHARRLVEERINDVLWFGDLASKVYGVLNYPSLAKQILPYAYDENAAGFGTTYDEKDLVKQLIDLGSTPRIRSGTRFKPNRLAVSPALHAFLTSRKHENAGGTDTTMLKFYLDNNTLGIREISEAPELAGIGPSGEDGLLYYRDDTDSIHATMLQSPTTLPVYQSGPLDQLTVVYAAIGGMVMGNVGNHILGLANVRAF